MEAIKKRKRQRQPNKKKKQHDQKPSKIETNHETSRITAPVISESLMTIRQQDKPYSHQVEQFSKQQLPNEIVTEQWRHSQQHLCRVNQTDILFSKQINQRGNLSTPMTPSQIKTAQMLLREQLTKLMDCLISNTHTKKAISKNEHGSIMDCIDNPFHMANLLEPIDPKLEQFRDDQVLRQVQMHNMIAFHQMHQTIVSTDFTLNQLVVQIEDSKYYIVLNKAAHKSSFKQLLKEDARIHFPTLKGQSTEIVSPSWHQEIPSAIPWIDLSGLFDAEPQTLVFSLLGQPKDQMGVVRKAQHIIHIENYVSSLYLTNQFKYGNVAGQLLVRELFKQNISEDEFGFRLNYSYSDKGIIETVDAQSVQAQECSLIWSLTEMINHYWPQMAILQRIVRMQTQNTHNLIQNVNRPNLMANTNRIMQKSSIIEPIQHLNTPSEWLDTIECQIAEWSSLFPTDGDKLSNELLALYGEPFKNVFASPLSIEVMSFLELQQIFSQISLQQLFQSHLQGLPQPDQRSIIEWYSPSQHHSEQIKNTLASIYRPINFQQSDQKLKPFYRPIDSDQFGNSIQPFKGVMKVCHQSLVGSIVSYRRVQQQVITTDLARLNEMNNSGPEEVNPYCLDKGMQQLQGSHKIQLINGLLRNNLEIICEGIKDVQLGLTSPCDYQHSQLQSGHQIYNYISHYRTVPELDEQYLLQVGGKNSLSHPNSHLNMKQVITAPIDKLISSLRANLISFKSQQDSNQLNHINRLNRINKGAKRHINDSNQGRQRMLPNDDLHNLKTDKDKFNSKGICNKYHGSTKLISQANNSRLTADTFSRDKYDTSKRDKQDSTRRDKQDHDKLRLYEEKVILEQRQQRQALIKSQSNESFKIHNQSYIRPHEPFCLDNKPYCFNIQPYGHNNQPYRINNQPYGLRQGRIRLQGQQDKLDIALEQMNQLAGQRLKKKLQIREKERQRNRQWKQSKHQSSCQISTLNIAGSTSHITMAPVSTNYTFGGRHTPFQRHKTSSLSLPSSLPNALTVNSQTNGTHNTNHSNTSKLGGKSKKSKQRQANYYQDQSRRPQLRLKTSKTNTLSQQSNDHNLRFPYGHQHHSEPKFTLSGNHSRNQHNSTVQYNRIEDSNVQINSQAPPRRHAQTEQRIVSAQRMTPIQQQHQEEFISSEEEQSIRPNRGSIIRPSQRTNHPRNHIDYPNNRASLQESTNGRQRELENRRRNQFRHRPQNQHFTTNSSVPQDSRNNEQTNNRNNQESFRSRSHQPNQNQRQHQPNRNQASRHQREPHRPFQDTHHNNDRHQQNQGYRSSRPNHYHVTRQTRIQTTSDGQGVNTRTQVENVALTDGYQTLAIEKVYKANTERDGISQSYMEERRVDDIYGNTIRTYSTYTQNQVKLPITHTPYRSHALTFHRDTDHSSSQIHFKQTPINTNPSRRSILPPSPITTSQSDHSIRLSDIPQINDPDDQWLRQQILKKRGLHFSKRRSLTPPINSQIRSSQTKFQRRSISTPLVCLNKYNKSKTVPLSSFFTPLQGNLLRLFERYVESEQLIFSLGYVYRPNGGSYIQIDLCLLNFQSILKMLSKHRIKYRCNRIRLVNGWNMTDQSLTNLIIKLIKTGVQIQADSVVELLVSSRVQMQTQSQNGPLLPKLYKKVSSVMHCSPANHILQLENGRTDKQKSNLWNLEWNSVQPALKRPQRRVINPVSQWVIEVVAFVLGLSVVQAWELIRGMTMQNRCVDGINL